MMSTMFPIVHKYSLRANNVSFILVPNVQLKHVKQSIMKLNVQANVCGMVSHVLQRDVTTLQSKNYVLDPTTMKVALGHQDFVSDFPPVNSTIT